MNLRTSHFTEPPISELLDFAFASISAFPFASVFCFHILFASAFSIAFGSLLCLLLLSFLFCGCIIPRTTVIYKPQTVGKEDGKISTSANGNTRFKVVQ